MSLLPAEKRHYRKGLTLGLTLAETFSIVVFILLLVCAALLGTERQERYEAERDRDEERADRLMVEELVRPDDMSFGDSLRWWEMAREMRERAEEAEAGVRAAKQLLKERGISEESADRLTAQAAEIQNLSQSLERMQRARERTAAQRDSSQLRATLSDLAALRRAVGVRPSVGPEEADRVIDMAARVAGLESRLENARSTIASLEQERRDSLASLPRDVASANESLRVAKDEADELRDRVSHAEQQRDDARNARSRLEEHIEALRLGTGIDPPPCWMDGDGNPQHMFRAVLTDEGIELIDISPARRREDDVEAARHKQAIEQGHVYDAAAFLRVTLPFYTLGVSRTEQFGPKGCRFWVQRVDRTGDGKYPLLELERHLSQRFYFRRP